jgi:hypothetical protein
MNITAILLATTIAVQGVTLHGIYSDRGDTAQLEERIAPQDIYITYLTQGKRFPSDFVTQCIIKEKLPLIVLRPTNYDTEYAKELAARLAQYNTPMLLQIDVSRSDKYKTFFRAVADAVHSSAPEVTVVWGISGEKITELSTLYVGDEYADAVALNIFDKADENGIITDPYPLFDILSYFEKSKPVVINLSVASYTEKGHKYYALQAAEEIREIYETAKNNPAVVAVNYISRSATGGDAHIDNCGRVVNVIREEMK